MNRLSVLPFAIVVAANVIGCNESRSPTGDGGPSRERPQAVDESTATPGTVIFRKGFETDPGDRGRPVALIAAALGVEDQVFRDAFRNVQPAHDGRPSEGQARQNKRVLLDALAKHGVTNETLDEVSDYYRYRPHEDEIWPVKPAVAKAVITDGEVTGFEIINAGSGYSSIPTVTVAGNPDVRVVVAIEFSSDFSTNGRVTKLTVSK